MARIICDTGPLVAFLDRREKWHSWALEQFATLTEPLVTCEAVIAEAAFLTMGRGLPPARFMQLFEREVVRIDFRFQEEWPSIHRLLETYSNVPMSVADACIVRMSEFQSDSLVFTLDRDFLIYRRNRRQRIPLLSPFYGT
jgi:predicted nucleic acid-binding protein